MSDATTYPPRGEFDGKHYTDHDGGVHVLVRIGADGFSCAQCSATEYCDGRIACGGTTRFDRVPGAYVPTDNERILMEALEKLIHVAARHLMLSQVLDANGVLEAVRCGHGASIK